LARAPLLAEEGASLIEGHPTGEQARSTPEIDRTMHIGAPERRKETGGGPRGGEHARRRNDLAADSASGRTTEHDDDSVTGLCGDQGPRELTRFTGPVREPGGHRAQAGRNRRAVDDPQPVVRCSLAQSQVQNG